MQRNRGFTLIEAIVAAGIGIFVVSAAFLFAQRAMRQQKKVELTDIRSGITSTINSQIGSKQNLLISIQDPRNEALRRCVEQKNTDADNDCVSGGPTSQVPFALWQDLGAGNRRQLTGIEADAGGNGPLYFSDKGEINCDRTKEDCPAFAAIGYFWPKCQGELPRCDIAETIFTRFIVRSAGLARNRYQVVSQPMESIFFDDSRKSEYSVKVSILKPRQTTQRCPGTTFLVAVNEDGSIECRCQPGFDPVDADGNGVPDLDPNGFPVCPPNDVIGCGPDELFKGVDNNFKPICAKTKVDCKNNHEFDDSNAVCPDGGWLETMNFGYCQPDEEADAKKDNPREITCDNNKGKCCKLIEL